MKKIYTLFIALLLSVSLFAGNFVMIPYANQQELNQLFNNSDLVIHHYTDAEVFATAAHFDASTMTLLDSDAFSGTKVYYLVRCASSYQAEYLEREAKSGQLLAQTDDFVVMKPLEGTLFPAKNDGMTAIFNRKAVLPKITRDFPVVTEENSDIRFFLDMVNMDSIQATVQHMQDYNGRRWDMPQVHECQAWIEGRFEAMGLEVTTQDVFYSGTQTSSNVIAIQRGTLYPDEYVVCGCHYDSYSFSGACPGADDNATGTASVLESARILSQYQFERSIIYCTFAAEEVGLYGSSAYAAYCRSNNMNIVGYFNNDMNGYLYGDEVHIDCIYPNSVAPIGDYYMNIGEVYFPEMQVRHVNFSSGDSDHTSFNQNGYMGIYPFEDYEHYSPYIHSPEDLIGTSVNTWVMPQRYCQMNIACVTEIAAPLPRGPIVMDSFVLDDSEGNQDGKLNPGETVTLTVTMKNTSEAPVNGVNVTMTCNNDQISILNGQTNFGNFAVGESKTVEAAFSFVLSDEATAASHYSLCLTASSGNVTCDSYARLISYDYALAYGSMMSMDDDGLLSPGETSDVRIIVVNNGNEMAFDLEAVLTSTSEYITINNPESNFGTIGAAMNGFGDFNLTLSADMPSDAVIPFSLTLSDSFGRISQLDFDFSNLCNVVFALHDSYGDGWNGAKIVVSFDDGTPNQDITCSGSDTEVVIPIHSGTNVSLTWQSGSYDNECSFVVSYENGDQITSGSGAQSGNFFSWLNNCAGVNILPEFCGGVEDLASTSNSEGVYLTWNAPADQPDSYDVYRETVFLGNVTATQFDDLEVTSGIYDYCVYAVYADCQSTYECIDVEFDPDGVATDFAEEVNIYPNPAKDQLTIAGNGLRSVAIYNLMGQEVMPSRMLNENTCIVNVSDLPSGLYIVVLTNNEGLRIAKSIEVR